MGESIRQAQPADEAAASQFEAIGWYPLLFLVTTAFGVFLATNIAYPFKRPDYFLLADAFLHWRTWIDVALMPTHVDVIDWQGRAYLPFGPGPAVLVMPLVALLGPIAANSWQPFINSAVAALDVVLLALLVRCIQPTARWKDVLWVVGLLAFSLPLWWITVRTGPWHFAQLTAVACALIGTLELMSRRRAWLIGVAFGLAILSRTTLVVAIPFFLGLVVVQARRDGRPAINNAAAFLAFPILALALTAWYDAARFGSPFESGYALAAVPPFLRDLRSQGLFSLSHLPYNLDLLLFHLPVAAPPPFFLRPDGYGLTAALASPGVALLVKADWSRPVVRWAAVTSLVVLVPSLLYYGGGWIQLGFRYVLDGLPFIAILAASAVRTPMGRWWKVLIAIGVAVNLWGIAWGYTRYLQ